MRRFEMVGVDLSVIILSYNTKKLLKECLESVVQSIKHMAQSEIIVVDNASTDESQEVVKSIKSKVESEGLKLILIENRENLGFAGGNNIGLKEAKGKYILFLNSDTEIYPNALKEAFDFMESDETIGAMTPKTLLFSEGMDPDCHRGFPTPWASITYFFGLEKIFPKNRLFGQYHRFYEDLNRPHEIDAGFGTFMMIRREVYQKIGGWDEKYFFYGEDLDYFYRIKHAGWKVMFYPNPLLKHHKGGSSGLRKESKDISPASKETRIKSARASIEAMEVFYRKFYQDKYPSWLTAMVLAGVKIKGFFRILLHQLRN